MDSASLNSMVPFDLARRISAVWSESDYADDQRWLAALMRDEAQSVVSILWRMLGREEDVLDVFQATICALISRGPGDIRKSRTGYFYRAAMNRAIEALRARRRRQHHWPKIAHQKKPEVCPPADGVLALADDVRRLQDAICELPDRLRSVILLRDIAQMPYRRVASLLGITSGTARLYRRHAVVRLAELMEE